MVVCPKPKSTIYTRLESAHNVFSLLFPAPEYFSALCSM